MIILNAPNFDKYPKIPVEGHTCTTGWVAIAQLIDGCVQSAIGERTLVTVDTYHGVYTDEIQAGLTLHGENSYVFDTTKVLRSEVHIANLVAEYVTDDPVFGFACPLPLQAFFDEEKLADLQQAINLVTRGTVLVVGVGATLVVPEPDLLIYADMPRREIQLRFRQNRIANLGATNSAAPFSYHYKRAFYVDWRVLDRHKKLGMDRWDYVLDTTREHEPKLITGEAFRAALHTALSRPFRVVPFFDPGPWGGQWLKEVIDLDRSAVNYAWGFDCVPEENSLLFSFDGDAVELPAIDLVLSHPAELLGEKVYEAFGADFPIRFDFLDTMQGGNLSLQVHPLHSYAREQFGIAYTQHESYYLLEAAEDAFVYLGLKEGISPESMIHALQKAQAEGGSFDVEKYVAKWPIKKHDHFLIPAGTVHCSGANSVVLEISATPFNFTFKLWDWGRLGLDEKPRPISLNHGEKNIQWSRTTPWTKKHLVNKIEPLAAGDGWREERTGLEEGSFIETRRHWFSKKVTHNTNGVVNVLNLIEGTEAIVESPTGAFEPFVVHYVETFIVPAVVGEYTIRPHGASEGKEIGTIKAYIRTTNLPVYRLN
jgi:mannose-6-phosphate isomerase class I